MGDGVFHGPPPLRKCSPGTCFLGTEITGTVELWMPEKTEHRNDARENPHESMCHPDLPDWGLAQFKTTPIIRTTEPTLNGIKLHISRYPEAYPDSCNKICPSPFRFVFRVFRFCFITRLFLFVKQLDWCLGVYRFRCETPMGESRPRVQDNTFSQLFGWNLGLREFL